MHEYKRFITKMRSMLFVSRSLNLTTFSCFLIKLYIYTYTNLISIKHITDKHKCFDSVCYNNLLQIGVEMTNL